jgi:hypothetical protein
MVTMNEPKMPTMPSPAGTTPRQPLSTNEAPMTKPPSGCLGTGHRPRRSSESSSDATPRSRADFYQTGVTS